MAWSTPQIAHTSAGYFSLSLCPECRRRLSWYGAPVRTHGDAEKGAKILVLGTVRGISFSVAKSHVITVHRIQPQEGGAPMSVSADGTGDR